MPHVSPSRSHTGSSREQDRILRMHRFLDPVCLARLRVGQGERILEVCGGSGIFARELARAAGGVHPVVCIERDETRIYRTLELASARGEDALLDVRQGELLDPPLQDEEWGTFDLVHCRFALQRVQRPQEVVRALARALRPGGRMVLTDDDHDLLRLWPPLPAVDELWRARTRAIIDRGQDPFIGRKLVALMRLCDLHPLGIDQLFFGGAAGDEHWDIVAASFVDDLRGAREEILAATAIAGSLFDEVLSSVVSWSQRPDAALWYPVCWAAAVRPA